MPARRLRRLAYCADDWLSIVAQLGLDCFLGLAIHLLVQGRKLVKHVGQLLG